MQNEELFSEIDQSQTLTQKYLGLSSARFFTLLLVIISFGVYVGILLYGTNSIEILLGLQEYESYLQSETIRLKLENSELQHQYFELKEISAE